MLEAECLKIEEGQLRSQITERLGNGLGPGAHWTVDPTSRAWIWILHIARVKN